MLCAKARGYGLVIIDGIRDLMLDINSTSESVEVINKMMEWSSKYDLHIHCVLHLNKGDNNVRGHIGTEMSNKAETVLVISKSNENPSISEVHALHIREKEFKPFAFTVDDGGLPVMAENHSFDGNTSERSKNRAGFMNLSVEQHREALSAAFGGQAHQRVRERVAGDDDGLRGNRVQTGTQRHDKTAAIPDRKPEAGYQAGQTLLL